MNVKETPIRASRLGLLLVCFVGGSALASEMSALRVCADPNNLPLSSVDQNGLENKIAALWAAELGVPVDYTWFPQRRGFIRKTLKAPDESGEGFKCDIVVGVAAEYDRLLTTRPYYRSTYALVYAKGKGLDGVTSGEQLLALDDAVKQRLRIGAFTQTPGPKWLARYGLTEQLVAYPAMSGDPDAYPGQIVEKQLAGGMLDAAVVWGPMAGYFANKVREVDLTVVPLQSEPGIRFDFAIAAGVRYGDGERKAAIERVMDKTAPQIAEILAEFRVPLMELTSEHLASDDD